MSRAAVRAFWPARSVTSVRRPTHTTLPTLLCLLGLGALCTCARLGAQEAEPYHFYGGDVTQTATNPAIEACEYRLLVEERRCNDALNKTACIASIHKACRTDPDLDFKDIGVADPQNGLRR